MIGEANRVPASWVRDSPERARSGRSGLRLRRRGEVPVDPAPRFDHARELNEQLPLSPGQGARLLLRLTE